MDVGSIKSKMELDTKGYKQSIDEVKAKAKETTTSMNGLTAALRQVGLSTSEINKIKDNLREANPEILEKQLGQVEQQLKKLGVESTQIDKIKEGLQDTEQQAGKTGASLDNIVGILAALGASKAFSEIKSFMTVAVGETNKLTNSMLGLSSVAQSFGEDIDSVQNAAQKLAEDGLAPVSTYATALKNLLQTGIGLDKAIELINNYKDRAAFGKAETIAFSQAVENLSQSFKTESSTLGDLAGQSENYSVILQEGLRIMQQRGTTLAANVEQLTQSERAEAKYLGTMALGQPYIGDSIKLTENYTGRQAQLNAKWTEAKQELGEAYLPLLEDYMNIMTPIVSGVANFASENKEMTAGLTTAGLALTALLTILPLLVVGINAVRTAMIGLNLALGPIGWTVALVATAATVFTAFGIGASAASESTLELINAQRQQVVELDKLITRFDELKGKPESTAEEMTELRDVQNELVKINPQLASSYDDVGNALVDTSDKAKELSDSMKKVLRAEAQLAYLEAIKSINKEQEKLNKLNDDLDSKMAMVERNTKRVKEIEEEIVKLNREEKTPLIERQLSIQKEELDALEKANLKHADGAAKLAKKVEKQDEEVTKLNAALNLWKDINKEIEIATVGSHTANDLLLEKQIIRQWQKIKAKTVVETEVEETTTTTGTGPRVKTPEEIANEFYRSEMKMLDFKRNMDQLSEEQEMASLEKMLDKYGKYADIRMDIEVKIHRIKKQLSAEAERMVQDQARSEEERIKSAFNFSKTWISDEEFRMKKSGDTEESIVQMKIDAWTRVKNRYEENTEFYKQADRALFDAQMDLLEIQTKAQEDVIKQTEKSIVDLTKKQISAIDEARRAELKALEVRRKAYVDGNEEKIRAIDRLIAKERELNVDEDYEAKLAKLHARADLLASAVGPDGIRERKGVLEEIERMKLEHDRDLRRRGLENEKQSLQDEKRLRDEAFNREKSDVEVKYDALKSAFDEFKDDISIIENVIRDLRISSNTDANRQILSDLDRFVAEYKSKMTQIQSANSVVSTSQMAQMQANSSSWHNASAEERRRLDEENTRLGQSQGWTRKDDGHWYDRNNVRVYHEGKKAGSLDTFSYSDRLLPDEIASIIRMDEFVFTKQQLSSLLSGVGDREKGSIVNHIDMSVNDVTLEDKADIETLYSERERVARRLQTKGEKTV